MTRQEVKTTKNIEVHRYQNADLQRTWQGYMEPEDGSWIAFQHADGDLVVYGDRDPATGAVRSPGVHVPVAS